MVERTVRRHRRSALAAAATFFSLLAIASSSGSDQFCQADGGEEKCSGGGGGIVEEESISYDDDFDAEEVAHWLLAQSKNVNSFCPGDSSNDDDDDDEEDLHRTVLPPRECVVDEETGWSGSVDKKGQPKGPGKVMIPKSKKKDGEFTVGNGGADKAAKKCVDLSPGVSFFSGRFSHGGTANGPGRTNFDWDGSSLQGSLRRGAHEGRTVLADSSGGVRLLAAFRGGRPHGPAWVVPPPDAERAGGYVYLRFHRGKIVEEKAALVSPDFQTVTVGRLVNGTFLSDPVDVNVKKTGEVSCIRALDLKGAKKRKKQLHKGRKLLRLPAVVKPMPAGRGVPLLVRSGKTVVFNRVAKTGSQSIAELLVQLKKRNKVEPRVLIHAVEELRQPMNMVAEFVHQVDSEAARGATAWVRHYNFPDFERFDAEWTPVHVNIVRDPVERIISWFYYWRAAWNIVERKMAYPQEPLPDPDYLRKDFDTCVLTGDPECVYSLGADVMLFPDHRSQVMAFCGHDDFCAKFGDERALEQAKRNVERYYPVVGVLEEMDKTLSVLEHELPEVFSGAAEVYNSHPEIRRKMNRNAYKLPVREETLERVRANFTREIEFYQFVRDRLDRQHQEVRATVLKEEKEN